MTYAQFIEKPAAIGLDEKEVNVSGSAESGTNGLWLHIRAKAKNIGKQPARNVNIDYSFERGEVQMHYAQWASVLEGKLRRAEGSGWLEAIAVPDGDPVFDEIHGHGSSRMT